MKEPSVTVVTIDKTTGTSATPVDNRLNILCPVITPYGPAKLTKVSGATEFKRLYFAGAGVTSKDSTSAIYARALLNNAPIWIKRCTNHALKGGKSSGGSNIYVTEDNQLILGKEISLSIDSVKVSEKITSTMSAGTPGKVLKGSTVYSSTSISDLEGDSNFIRSKSQLQAGTKLSISGKTTTGITLVIGSKIYSIEVGTTDFTELTKQLVADGYFPQAVASSSAGLNLDLNASPLSVPAGITSISFLNKLAITGAGDTISVATSGTGTIYSYEFKSQEDYEQEYKLSSASVTVEFADGQKACFYVGSKPSSSGAIFYKLSENSVTFDTFLNLLAKESKVFYTSFGSSPLGIRFIVPNAESITLTGLTSNTAQSVNPSVLTDRFAVISNNPCKTDAIQIKLTKVDVNNELYKVVASYQDMTEEWTFGFNANLIDGFGNSLNFTRVNEESSLISIVELEGNLQVDKDFSIGSEISGIGVTDSDLSAGLEEVVENEEFSTMFDYICDGGTFNATTIGAVKKLCDKFHSFYPATCPIGASVTEVRNYRSVLGDFFYGNFICASQKAQVIDGGVVDLPGSYWYLATRIGLGNTAQEFRSIFGPTFGGIGITNPTRKYTVSEREALLEIQVPTLSRDFQGNYFLNKNSTLYPTLSYLQEDSNALSICKINQIADAYGITLIGSKQIPESLFSQVTLDLTRLLSQRLRVGTDDGPARIRVQCDKDNNVKADLDRMMLRIDIYANFTRSVADVKIYSTVLPLQ